MPGARLIINSRYFHIARAGEKADGKHSMTKDAAMGLVNYVGTREGVEFNIPDQLSLYDKNGSPLNLDPLQLSSEVAARPTTQKQINTIKNLLEVIPEAKNSLEYQDYKEHQTIGNATELISHASELGLGYAVDYGKAVNLVEYVGKRPGVDRVGEHGLFSSFPNVDIKKAQEDIANCKGNIWTHVISLRREDADMLGYNQQEPWRNLVMQKIDIIAKASDIPSSKFHWYAGMHNTTHHPHIHLFVFSDNPKDGCLTVDGINEMKSAFSGVIFAGERHQIYIHKDEMRDEIKHQVDNILEGLSSDDMKYFSKAEQNEICLKLTHLASDLKDKAGKKQYGWLLRDMGIREQVNDIMADLAKTPEIQKLYNLYCADHIALERMYREDPKDLSPIVNNKEFRSVKNKIIREAMKLGNTLPDSAETEQPVFSSPDMDGEIVVPDENGIRDGEPSLPCTASQVSLDDSENFASLLDSIPPEQEPSGPEYYPETYVQDGDGPVSEEYVIETHHPKKNADFKEVYFNAVEKREPKAMYALAKRYFYGQDVEQDYTAAQMWYGLAAEAGHSMSKYELGKMNFYGIGIDRNEKLGKEYFLDAYYDFTEELQKATGIDLEQDHFMWNDLPPVNSYYGYLEYLVGRMRLAEEGVDINFQYAFDWFRAASLHGHVHSEYMLGKMINDGQGVPQSYADAAGYFAEAAEKGDKYAAYAVGRMYYRGIGVTQDFSKAVSFFAKAAEENVPYADYTLAQMAEDGQGMEKSAENASLLYKKALNEFIEQEKQQPDPLTKFRIAKMHLTGKGAEKNPAEGVKWLEKAVGGGNAQAEYELAMMSASGELIPKDDEKAAELFEKALVAFISSDKDHPSAGQEYRIAQMYEKGLGATVSYSEAVKWYSAAAENGHGHAAYRLGKFYADGISIPQDYDMALKWFHRAAELKDKYAYFALGKAFFDGTGTERDYSKSAAWFQKASDEGLPFASYRLAAMYRLGIGIDADTTKASELYSIALSGFRESDNTNPDVQLEYRIGSMYLNGEGIATDPQEALNWFLKSADGGNAFAAYQAAQILLDKKDAHWEGDETQGQKLFSDALAGFLSLEKDKPDAQLEYRIGSMYLNGKGTAVDLHKALERFLKSADGGNAFAAYQAAQILSDKKDAGRDGDETQEEQLYSDALSGFLSLEKDNPDAQLEYRIGSMYLNGKGARKDIDAAMFWFRLSAQYGNPYAEYQMAELFDEGTKIPKADATQFYAKALIGFLVLEHDGPDTMTEYRIGSMYLSGKGTKRDPEEAIHWFEQSAQKGNHYAEYQMAELYLDGTKVARDEIHAQNLFSDALQGFMEEEQKSPDAQLEYRIGDMYLNGQGTKKHVYEAIRWFEQSIEKGNFYAEYRMAELYQEGTEISKDEELAQYLFSHALQGFLDQEKDNPDAQLEYRIASMYLNGQGTQKNTQEAIRWLDLSAKKGNSNAKYQMAELYWDGSKVPKDETKAQALFADALKDFIQKEKENPDAQLEYRIGGMFLAGKGTAKNAFQALHWFELSAKKGNHYAEYQIAELYEDGKDISQNKARAQIYYNRALNGFLEAEQKSPDASMEYRIGQMFYMGQGALKNYQAAWQWFSLSAAKDNTYALLQQAHMVQKGEGVPKSEQRAQALYTEAFQKLMKALHDDPSPQLRYRIGTMYEFGLGVERNVTTAKEWYQQAAQEGDENAENRLQQIAESERDQAIGSVMGLFRFFARTLGHNVEDSTSHKYHQDRKLLQKQHMLHKQQHDQEQIL